MAVVYSADEVSEHDSEKDLWMTIHGGVYDLTSFLSQHPGGEDVLLNLGGQDGTVCFDEIGHTEEAIKLRETMKIGEVTGISSAAGGPKTAKKGEPTVDDDDWVYQGGPKKDSSSQLPLFLVIGAVAYGVVAYYLFL